MIITFEGGEGVGKTTQTALLAVHLEKEGRSVVTIREPGGSALSEKIRALFVESPMDAMTELLLVLASRRENITQIIEPVQEAGKTIIIDRFIDSTLVYQGLVGGLGIEKVKAIMQATGTWLEPDTTFVLDMAPELACSRFAPSDRFEHRDTDYHRRLREGFLAISTDKRHRIIDAAQSQEGVFRAIIARLEKA